MAACACGGLTATCAGEPVRVGICHCRQCQRRTGSAFGAQARFPVEQVAWAGPRSTWTRTGDSGGTVTFTFCPTCGSTVGWQPGGLLDFWMVAVGAFADADFPAPEVSAYGDRMHPWVRLPEGVEEWA